MKKICVIGSINMDLTTIVHRFPKPGETISGIAFGNYPGGKGANQAVAAGKLGATVAMFGKLGDDYYGAEYQKVFEQNRVEAYGIDISKGTASGLALIQVDMLGENSIIVIPGANSLVDTEFIDYHLEQLSHYDIFLFQLEIPIETVSYAIKRLKDMDKIIILDPAPAAMLPEQTYQNIDYITPNETEIELLTGIKINEIGDLEAAAAILLQRGVGTVIAKSGRQGAYIIDRSGVKHVKGYSVDTIDTTAAGDSFNAGLAFSLSIGNNVEDSVAFANAVAALSTTALGAQEAMPKLEQVKKLMETNNK